MPDPGMHTFTYPEKYMLQASQVSYEESRGNTDLVEAGLENGIPDDQAPVNMVLAQLATAQAIQTLVIEVVELRRAVENMRP